ncbi:hypothetical protein ACIBEJ_03090 [Nonomuraea sp. NPDC050790]|uniref:hypothetical protein n=1 Tax=Nonomuraea sp. NPDC050790 TaxID=3364371 RepID=UPI0037AF45DB
MTVQDLREVLREHGSAAPPPNPARRTQIEARIRRRRLRRTAVAGGAIAAAVALAAALIPGTAERPAPPVAVKPAPLPETFTSPDGTQYRRLAATTVVTPGRTNITLTLPLTGNPVDLAATCEGPTRNIVTPTVAVGGLMRQGDLGGCTKETQLLGLEVPKGAGKAEVVIDIVRPGSACWQDKPGGRCVERKPERAVWSLAFYEWIPPAQPVSPAAPRPLPKALGTMKLSRTESGTWPEQDTVTFRTNGGKIGIEKICTGDLAGRLTFTVAVNGEDTGTGGTCAVWKRDPFPWGMALHTLPKGRTSTVTLKLRMKGAHHDRPVRWSAGLYR